MINLLGRKKYPLRSTSGQIRRALHAADVRIRRNLTPRQVRIVKALEKEDVFGKNATVKKYEKSKQWEDYERKLVAQNIARHKRAIDRRDPDAYIIGGMAGSGKTSVVVKKYLDKVEHKAININADYYKGQIAKREPSPIRSKPLAHAALLHETSDKLFVDTFAAARKKKMNIILDATLGNPDKAARFVRELKAAGYKTHDIHLYGVQVYPHQAIRTATGRFLHGEEGRFVSPKIIQYKGPVINRTLGELAPKRIFGSAVMIDNSFGKGKQKVIYRRGRII